MSMIGLAPRPGTAVLPMCSITADSPSTRARRSFSISNTTGHIGE
jgi:hypothetical protein